MVGRKVTAVLVDSRDFPKVSMAAPSLTLLDKMEAEAGDG